MDQNDVMRLWPVRVVGAAGTGGECHVDAHLLPGGGARQHQQDHPGVLQPRRDGLDRGHDDMPLRQALAQVAIALVGDDDAPPRFGDQHVDAGDPHLGLDVLFAQDRAGLGRQRVETVEDAVRIEKVVRLPERVADLRHGHVGRRNDDMQRMLAPQLDDALAWIRLDRRDPVLLQRVFDPAV
ncbi:MAG: hypothetical protein AAGI51_13100, partial [Pseudomonadota bacterium]